METILDIYWDAWYEWGVYGIWGLMAGLWLLISCCVWLCGIIRNTFNQLSPETSEHKALRIIEQLHKSVEPELNSKPVISMSQTEFNKRFVCVYYNDGFAKRKSSFWGINYIDKCGRRKHRYLNKSEDMK